MKSWLLLTSVTLMSCASLGLGYAEASTVERITFSEMAKIADVIVQASVEPGRSIVIRDNDIPWTCLTLHVEKVFKGTTPSYSNICFLGGTAGSTSLSVADSYIPPEGADGIFFLQNQSARYVSPLVGWAQGAFLIQTVGAASTLQITSADGYPVTSIDQIGKDNQEGNAHIAQGVLVSTDRSSSSITLQDFITGLHMALVGSP